MPASFVHIQVAKEAVKQLLSSPIHEQYRRAMEEFLPFVLLGSVSPDYPYIAAKGFGVDPNVAWGDTLHTSKTFNNVAVGLRILSAEADKGSDAFMKKLAWLMGYYSHIMTDVVVHPVLYRLVGPYASNPNDHARCELNQDTLLCNVLLNMDVHESNHLHPLSDCSGLSNPFPAIEAKQIIIQEHIGTFWKDILQENYPAECKRDSPDVDAWHRVFIDWMPHAVTGKYIFGKLPVDDSLLYRRGMEIPIEDKNRTFFAIDMPDNRTAPGNYKNDIYDIAVTEVCKGLGGLLDGLTNTSYRTAFNATLQNWCLDDGTTDGVNYTMWPYGKTSDTRKTYPVST